MKYTYEISFNGSDYADLYPNSDIEMKGGWEQGTMIWREKISELKITKALNDTAYDTLESWFDDSDYFATRIYVKILKNDVQDSLHWFGVKWGKIDRYLKTYTVEPNAYDLWGRYFETNKDTQTWHSITSHTWYAFDNQDTYEYIANTSFSSQNKFKTAIKAIVYKASGLNIVTTDVISSFLWQDDYEDGTPIADVRGMPVDYVTGAESFLEDAGIKMPYNCSLSDAFQWLLLFRAYCFLDSNDKFRIEHISFFNDKLTDNAVDFSAYIEDYNDVWEYENTNIPTVENLQLSTPDLPSSNDFREVAITYSDVRNRPDATAVEFNSSIYTDIEALGTEDASELTMWAGFENHAYKFFDISMYTFSATKNSFDVVWDVDNSKTSLGSNDFKVDNGQDFDFYMNLADLNGQFEVSIVDRSSSAVISNVLTITTAGVNSDTLTTTAAANDAFLLIEAIAPTGPTLGDAEGWLTLKATLSNRSIIPVTTGVISGSVQTNGALSLANIVNAYWKDDRMAKSGTFNDTVTEFDSIYNLKRDPIKIHYSGVINPLYGFNDGTRIGKIDKWTRSLETDFYEIDVIYQEDE